MNNKGHSCISQFSPTTLTTTGTFGGVSVSVAND
jgi:hypothetical protein